LKRPIEADWSQSNWAERESNDSEYDDSNDDSEHMEGEGRGDFLGDGDGDTEEEEEDEHVEECSDATAPFPASEGYMELNSSREMAPPLPIATGNSWMVIKYRNAVSGRGIPADVLKSALQKSIRIGDIRAAMWISREVEDFYHASIGGLRYSVEHNDKHDRAKAQSTAQSMLIGIVTNFISRILVTYLEDVECGTPEIKHLIHAKMIKVITGRKNPRNFPAHEFGKCISFVMAIMTNAPRKSRLYSLVKHAHISALAGHTAAWNGLSRVLLNGTPVTIVDLTSIADSYQQIGCAKKVPTITELQSMKIPGTDTKSTKFWYQNIPSKEKWLAVASGRIWPGVNKAVRDAFGPKGVYAPSESDTDVRLGTYCDTYIPSIVFSSASVDRHTKMGKSHPDKGFARFALIGSLVSNPVSWLDHSYTSSYTWSKLPVTPGIESCPHPIDYIFRETDFRDNLRLQPADMLYSEKTLIQFEVRPQVTCSGDRQDTYFGRMWGFPVLVKGPYRDTEQMVTYDTVHMLKLMLGLSSVEPHVIYMVPDMWEHKLVPEMGDPATFASNKTPLAVPLGLRNKLVPDKSSRSKLPFIIFRSLIPEHPTMQNLPTIPYGYVTNYHSFRLSVHTRIHTHAISPFFQEC
jgi:hypothetical protein